MKIKNFLLLAIGLVLSSFTIWSAAEASALTFTNSQNVTLVSPATTLVIATSSVADSLTVSTSSVAVGMSNSTGGTFVISSLSYGFLISPSASGGTVTQTCNGSTTSATISQATNSAIYTITTAASQCGAIVATSTTPDGFGTSIYTSEGNGTKVNNSINDAWWVDYSTRNGLTNSTSTTISISTSTASSTTVVSPSACRPGDLFDINTGARCPTTSSVTTTVIPINTSFIFTKDLSFNMTDPQVKMLQQFLNGHGFIVALSGAGSAGKETNYFGAATRVAVIKFQKMMKITPAVGYFGPTTRGVVNGR